MLAVVGDAGIGKSRLVEELRSWCASQGIATVDRGSVRLDAVKSPWKTVSALDPGGEYLVLASSIPPKSVKSTWKLFRGSRAVRRQLLNTDGVMGFSMLAEPLRKHYATLSVWRDEAALDDFARAHPHDQLVVALVPDMGETKFVRWTTSGADGRPSWKEALERLT